MRYTRKLINRKRKKIRNMKGGTNAQKEAIDETLKLAKQILELSDDMPTHSNNSQMVDSNTSQMVYLNTLQMVDLSEQIQDVWNSAYSGQNVFNMSKNVTYDEKSQLRELKEELARLEEEFEKEGKGIKRKKKSSTKRTTKRTCLLYTSPSPRD